MRVLAPMLVLVMLGCGGGDGGSAELGDSSGEPSDGGDEASLDATSDVGDDGAPSCAPATASIALEGATTPGSAVTLKVAAPAGTGVAWKVSGGSLSSDLGVSTTWTIPATAAVHHKETLTVDAVTTKSGCVDRTLTLDVVVDWPDSRRTVVVYSTSSTGSKDVAQHYAAYRKIPDAALCAVAASDPTQIPSAEYGKLVDTVMACVASVGAQVQYLVPVWGVPYKVDGQVHDLGDPSKLAAVSLDALLAYGAKSKTLTNTLINPIFQGKDPRGGSDSKDSTYAPYVPFGALLDKSKSESYLVARIDGADAAAAMALVDRTRDADALASAGKLEGIVYVDGNKGLPHPADDSFGSYDSGEWNMIGTENVFKALGTYKIVADYDNAEFGTAPAPLTAPDALYYAGWYSFGHYNDVFTWKTGAIGAHLDSCSACDIRGSTDWSAVALRRGITATFGAVNEPYVAGLPEYDQFFLYLTQGASFGEAGYEATAEGAWMVVFVGDPLYRPYRAKAP